MHSPWPRRIAGSPKHSSGGVEDQDLGVPDGQALLEMKVIRFDVGLGIKLVENETPDEVG